MAKLANAVRKAYARPLTAPLVLSALLFAPLARAVDLDSIKRSISSVDVVKPGYNSWRIVPTLDVRQMYTDNANRQPSSRARGAFITDVSPGLLINHKGPRLTVDGQYLLHLIAHTGDDYGRRRSSSQLRASAKAELVDDMVFVDSSASMQLQSISPFAPAATDYGNANSANVRTWQVSPYIVNRYGRLATSELRYVRDSVDAGNSGLSSTDSDTVAFRLNSGAYWDQLDWALSASQQQIQDRIRNDSTIRTAVLNLGYQGLPTFAVTATGYYDDYDYESVGGRNGGSGATGGFRWTPSQRTSVAASYGRRYYGPSRNLKALHRTRRTAWEISYDDSVMTARSNFLQRGAPLPGTPVSGIPTVPSGPVAADLGGLFTPGGPPIIVPPPAIPPAFGQSINFFSNRYFLQEQLRANMSIRLARTTGLFSVYKLRREALSLRDTDAGLLNNPLDTVNDNIEQVGISALGTYRITARSNLALSADVADNTSLTNGFKARSSAVRLTLGHQLGRNIGATAELRRTTGVIGMTAASKYTENALSIALNMKL